MAYVSVPKDLTKVKNKVAFNLTKRQLICIGIGAAIMKNMKWYPVIEECMQHSLQDLRLFRQS